MVILNHFYPENNGSYRKGPKAVEKIWEGDINRNNMEANGAHIETTASGGFKLVIKEEDEFGIPSKIEIILEREDVETIKNIIQNLL